MDPNGEMQERSGQDDESREACAGKQIEKACGTGGRRRNGDPQNLNQGAGDAQVSSSRQDAGTEIRGERAAESHETGEHCQAQHDGCQDLFPVRSADEVHEHRAGQCHGQQGIRTEAGEQVAQRSHRRRVSRAEIGDQKRGEHSAQDDGQK